MCECWNLFGRAANVGQLLCVVQGQHRSDLFTCGYLELGKLLRNLSMSSRCKQRAHPNQTPVRPERTLRPIPTAEKVQWGKKVRKFHDEGLPDGFLARMQRAISTGARLVNRLTHGQPCTHTPGHSTKRNGVGPCAVHKSPHYPSTWQFPLL